MKFSHLAVDLTLKDIQLIAFDFDGIFTDDKVYVDENGKESVACSRIDSLGIARLIREISAQKLKTRLVVISTETNAVVSVRCEKMKLQAFTGVDDKASFVQNYARTHGVDLDFSVYAGNDLNDFSAMMLFGVKIAPANAHPKIQQIATLNLESFGGNGFIRELVEIISPEAFSY